MIIIFLGGRGSCKWACYGTMDRSRDHVHTEPISFALFLNHKLRCSSHCPFSCKIHAIFTELKLSIGWLSPNAALLEKFIQQVFTGHKMCASLWFKRCVFLRPYVKKHIWLLWLLLNYAVRQKQMLVRFIFTVSFRRKGSVKLRAGLVWRFYFIF